MGRIFVGSFLKKSGSVCAAVLGLLLASAGPFVAGNQAGPPQTTAPKAPPAVGTIKAISGNALTLATDGGAELEVLLSADLKLVRVPPDSKDLKEAAPIELSELQEGDRIVVRGKAGDDPRTFV